MGAFVQPDLSAGLRPDRIAIAVRPGKGDERDMTPSVNFYQEHLF